MKKTAKLMALALALVMVMSLASVASATPTPVQKDADITFVKGSIVIPPDPEPGKHGFDAMLLKFGSRKLPIRQERYVADGTSGSTTDAVGQAGPYTEPRVGLLVENGDDEINTWTLKGRGTTFDVTKGVPNAATSWSALINLSGAAGYTSFDGLNGSGIPNPPSASTNLTIPSADIQLQCAQSSSTVTLMSTSSAQLGEFGVWWTNDNIYLEPASADWNKIKQNTYTCVMTWSLETT